MKWIVFVLCAALLAACGSSPAPAAAPIGSGVIRGYDTKTAGHISKITLHAHAAGDPGEPGSVGYAYEGDRVDILERRADGPIKVRTKDGIEGWTDSEFVQ